MERLGELYPFTTNPTGASADGPALAARAGAGKATIYRWWQSKGTLAIEVDSHAAGKSISITVLAVHGNGDRLEFELNGEVNGDTLAGTYHLKLTVGSDVTETSGTFSLTRLPG